MKCPKCGNEKFVVTVTTYNRVDCTATIEDDGLINFKEVITDTFRDDSEYSDTAKCDECGNIIAIPGRSNDVGQERLAELEFAERELQFLKNSGMRDWPGYDEARNEFLISEGELEP
ncbi:MAG: hypothetical protein WC343_09075 [Bacilli bacterium]|jgi:hypothetical protein